MPRRAPSPSSDSSPANLESIANALGIAVSTVSRALRNHPGIHPTTRLKVQTEAARLGYQLRRRSDSDSAGGNEAVRHLLTLAQSVNSASQQGYLAGISRAAQAHNIGVFSHHSAPQYAGDLLSPGHTPAALRVPDLAGIIFIHRWPETILDKLSRDRPSVSIIHRYPDLPVDTVGTDDESGLRLLVRHLQAGGHERIGFFGYEPGFSWARSRFAAYIAALTEAGLPQSSADVISVAPGIAHSYEMPDVSASLSAVRARIRAGTRAWISASYVLGQGLVAALRGAGYSLPDEVAVTGYHAGSRPAVSGLPRLTSIEVDDEAIGAAAVHLLDHRIRRSVPAPTLLLLPGRLAVGETTQAVGKN
jgi:DNA-binding LacI/PurR family transcriptional regulator